MRNWKNKLQFCVRIIPSVEIFFFNYVRVYLLPATVTGNKFFIKRYDMKLAESTELFKTRGKVNLLHAIAFYISKRLTEIPGPWFFCRRLQIVNENVRQGLY